MKKRTTAILATILFVMAGCGGGKQSADDFITVDVTQKYSYKKELILQDFMDVEYIPLETNDEFITQGLVQDIGEEIIVVKNRNDDGDIFVYDRSGKALRKINRKGQGNEEYTHITTIVLDEENGEMFLSDHTSRKIIVYDFYGKFKRSFKHKNGSFEDKDSRESLFYTDIFNYDKDNLICYDTYNEEIAFVLISKRDGKITREIEIPFKEKKVLMQTKRDESNIYVVGPGPFRSIIPFKGNWLLLEPSSDTVAAFSDDYSLQTFIKRTPSVQTMNPGIFLILRVISTRYYFMEAITSEYDWDKEAGFPTTYFVYDTQDRSFSGYTVYNDDFSTQKEIYMNATTPVNHEIESWYPLQAHQLVESYRKGELKGKLKEIAVTLDEESNPVIMLIKHKK